MKHHRITWLAMLLFAFILVGCGTAEPTLPSTEVPASTATPTEPSTEVPTEAPTEENTETTVPVTAAPTEIVPETTSPQAELPDLETLYNQGMEVLSQMGEDALILFPETDVNYLNNFYPGLADLELKQLYAGVAPVTNAPFEIILVEVANEADVPTVIEIFQARVDRESGDSTYPENAEAWMNKTRITSRGNYVFLAVLMGSYEIPAQFILD